MPKRIYNIPATISHCSIQISQPSKEFNELITRKQKDEKKNGTIIHVTINVKEHATVQTT